MDLFFMSLGTALEGHFNTLSLEADQRDGLHISDVCSTTGWHCTRYLHLIFFGFKKDRGKMDGLLSKRFKLGTGYHHMIYEYAEAALQEVYGSSVKNLEVSIETPGVCPDTGVILTPDIKCTFEFQGRKCVVLFDMKTSTLSTILHKQAKGSRLSSADSLRTMLCYLDFYGAEYGSFVFMSTNEVDEDSSLSLKHPVFFEETVVPTGKAWDKQKFRMDQVVEATAKEQWVEPNYGKRCNACKMKSSCQKVQTEYLERPWAGPGGGA